MNVRCKWFIVFVCAMLCVMCSNIIFAGENLKVLTGQTEELLRNYLNRQVEEQYEARSIAIEKALKTPENIAERQNQLLENYRSILGTFPEKTPLNAQVTGTIHCDGYRIEKVAYESRPNHHVTANFYIPTTGSGPYPSVLVTCGHSTNGKAYDAYQRACILLAKNGFAALIIDPIGQGERHNFIYGYGFRREEESHTLLTVGANLVGSSVVAYEIWDNTRGIDYLVSRVEVDPSRIGLTGNSGGGTQTTFLMPLDDRIGPAAPSCYFMARKIIAAGPADGCQHVAGEGALGIDHADYAVMRAPKPTIILAADKDYFDIKEVHNAYNEAKRFYTVLGFPDNIEMFSYPDEHGFSKPRRQAMVQWMRRWLMNDNSTVIEPELTVQDERDLWVCKSGEVMLNWQNEMTVQDINLKRAKELAPERERFWKDYSKAECLGEVRRLIGLREHKGKPIVENVGTLQRKEYRIEKLVIRRPGEVPVPGLLFVPDFRSGKLPAVLYVNGSGKHEDAAPDGTIANHVENGKIVLAIDVRGFGETADERKENAAIWNNERGNIYLSWHIGRPLIGQRVEDVLSALDILMARNDVDQDAICLVGIGSAGLVALHAAALDSRFAGLTLRRSITSWLHVITAPLAHNQLTYVVPFALTRYDLPDLVDAIAPRNVQIIEPVDAYGTLQLP